jgi:hypothetical protein
LDVVEEDDSGVVTADGYYKDLRTGNVSVDERYITQLMTGVPYNEQVVSNNALDTDLANGNSNGQLDPPELANDPFKERPIETVDFYEEMLRHNAELVSDTGWNVLTIGVDVQRDTDGYVVGYTVNTWLGSDQEKKLVYSKSGIVAGTNQDASSLIGRQLTLRLQNHWDSGVQFRKAKITPRNP